jgi:hypothetical protein
METLPEVSEDITVAPEGAPLEAAHKSKSPKGKEPSKGKQAAASGFQYGPVPGQYFRSRRVKPEDVQMPWLDKPHPRQKWGTILPLIGLGLGLMVTAIMIWDGFRVIGRHKYCEIFYDDFTSLNESVWTKEVELGGYG